MNRNFMVSDFPLVSICFPTYNREKHVLEAIESIRGQSYKNIEIIIVDNDSKDKTFEIIEKNYQHVSNVHIYKNDSTITIARNWNRCIDFANGELIGIFHSDDVYHVNIVQESVSMFNEYPEIGMTSTYGNKIDMHGVVIDDYKIPKSLIDIPTIKLDDLFKEILQKDNVIMTPSVIVKKDVYDQLGKFPTTLAQSMDYDLWLQISEKYPIKLINKKLMSWREHESQESSDYRNYEKIPEMISVYERWNDKYNNKYSKYLNKFITKILFYNSTKLNTLGEFEKSINVLKYLKNYVSNITLDGKAKISILILLNKFSIKVNLKLFKRIRNLFY
jgi:glycosyltransferase involved in cell wall biosynthesis